MPNHPVRLSRLFLLLATAATGTALVAVAVGPDALPQAAELLKFTLGMGAVIAGIGFVLWMWRAAR
jgi:hypothetical protein